ncbi:hypothetical protein DWF00_09780 [Bosea caraganae]|uniref:histidine kinase n=1 Tax=Bosea caraganae TaxID=2763117 RepID=A0A370LBR2_9HYPH|nr:histidine kinase [Bosea caraganae]RDJ27264.1 hypothetical protein DWF00_09780 [Bosea caraganae]RDJ29280.1 hypothetical protein DWE98_01550 [Bosea caraganae]
MNAPSDEKVGKDSGSKGGASELTFGHDRYRLWSVVLLARWQERWAALSLERRFMIAASLVVGLSMVTLGYWVEKRIRAGWAQGMAETGSLYLEAFLAPHVQVLETEPALPPENGEAIASLLSDKRLGSRVAAIKVWGIGGELLFSTRNKPAGERLSTSYLTRLKAGQIIVNADKGQYRSRNVEANLIEIYAPVHKIGTSQVIAVGEFYEYSQLLDREINQLRYATWFLILNVALIIGILLYATVRHATRVIKAQQSLLQTNLARAAALAKRNNALRRAADRARLNAAVLNEAYLARVGADIHDGPIQMLSLLMLKLPDAQGPQAGSPPTPASDIRREFEPLLTRALAEMRYLSAGLVLPEIEGLSPAETIELAITRHEQQTGTAVERSLTNLPEQLPEAIRVCTYRIVQEGLTNAYKHAAGHGQRVVAAFETHTLDIIVSDDGPPPGTKRVNSDATKLGLRGMEMRVQSLRGRLTMTRLASGGMEVRTRLPVTP